jgi:hypothetical protein
MKTDAQSLILLFGGAVFLAYLVLKLLVGLSERDGDYRHARQRTLAAKRRGSDRSMSNAERAAAFREAASAALEGLGRAGLAAAFARRAERLEPGNPDAVSFLAVALRRTARYSALERFLWRRLADQETTTGPAFERPFEELVALYEGPLRRPETARVLRRIVGKSAVAPTT